MKVAHLNDSAAGVGLAYLLDGGVPCVAQNDETGFACQQLQDDALHFAIHAVLSGNHDDGQILIHQSQGAMLHLPCQNALTVDEGHLLDLR